MLPFANSAFRRGTWCHLSPPLCLCAALAQRVLSRIPMSRTPARSKRAAVVEVAATPPAPTSPDSRAVVVTSTSVATEPATFPAAPTSPAPTLAAKATPPSPLVLRKRKASVLGTTAPQALQIHVALYCEDGAKASSDFEPQLPCYCCLLKHPGSPQQPSLLFKVEAALNEYLAGAHATDPELPSTLDELPALCQLAWSFGRGPPYQVGLYCAGPEALEAALLHLHHFSQWRLPKLYPHFTADLPIHTSGLELPTVELPGWQVSRVPNAVMDVANCAGPRRGPHLRLHWTRVGESFLLTISGNAFPLKDALDSAGLERSQSADGSWIRTGSFSSASDVAALKEILQGVYYIQDGQKPPWALP